MRTLLLLITLLFNTLYPVVGYGSVCASDKTNEVREQTNTPEQATINQDHCNHENKTDSCDCCDNPVDSIDSRSCDSGCCVDSVTSSIPLTTVVLIPTLHPIALKPALAAIPFYSRPISPELQPPLV